MYFYNIAVNKVKDVLNHHLISFIIIWNFKNMIEKAILRSLKLYSYVNFTSHFNLPVFECPYFLYILPVFESVLTYCTLVIFDFLDYSPA